MTRNAAPGRPRGFDADETLERCMRVFWAEGYRAASYPALEAATGLHRQSLRGAFGDKEALFLAALRHFLKLRHAEITSRLNGAPRALDGIRRVFELWRADTRHPVHPGCLSVQSLTELGDELPAATKAIAEASERTVEALAAAFARAQEEGDIRPGLDPARIARQVTLLSDGLMVHARSDSDAWYAVFDDFLTQIAP